MKTSSQLKVGSVYTRDTLRDQFGITDATLKNGIFRLKGTESVWLFVTEEKTPDRVQYADHLDGDELVMQGQTQGRTDALIRDQTSNGLELLVFHRAKKYEHEGAGFRYEGPFNFIRSVGTKPSSFVLQRDNGKQYKYGNKPTWRWALHGVQQMGGKATKAQIAECLKNQVDGFAYSNLNTDLRLITVNHPSRSSWPMNGQPRRTDGWNPYDALFRRGKGADAVFELYDPAQHGVWELAPDQQGVMRPQRVTDSAELLQAQEEAERANAFDPADSKDARDRVVASIVRRRGQDKFRRALLVAYEHCCAVTGCPVVQILEGAHIRPYMGSHTNHVTNGLLLRADIHTLFDLGLLRIHPDTLTIEVAAHARRAYVASHGRKLAVPTHPAMAPEVKALNEHYQRWAKAFQRV